ncbi:hypothetical protein QAD02_007823 [Eretmocerus hayati]|uniref:Uncharacterized protein n=1 Tax=Eretmocerus hayati TaxID=131215 RepID=A0ACC2N642_9HYME|nr:hypothetical protein QAD02_007823 [Eretmocerus hayati]
MDNPTVNSCTNSSSDTSGYKKLIGIVELSAQESSQGSLTELTVGNVIAIIDPSSLASIFPAVPTFQSQPTLSNAIPSLGEKDIPSLDKNSMDPSSLASIFPAAPTLPSQPILSNALPSLGGKDMPSLDQNSMDPSSLASIFPAAPTREILSSHGKRCCKIRRRKSEERREDKKRKKDSN